MAESPTSSEKKAYSQWCERHWQPYRDKQGNGLIASILLMQNLANNMDFVKACGYDPATGAKAEAKRMNLEIVRISPICCYLGDDVMQEIFTEARGEVDA